MRDAQAPYAVLLAVENAENGKQYRRGDHIHEAAVNMQRAEYERGNDDRRSFAVLSHKDTPQVLVDNAPRKKLLQYRGEWINEVGPAKTAPIPKGSSFLQSNLPESTIHPPTAVA